MSNIQSSGTSESAEQVREAYAGYLGDRIRATARRFATLAEKLDGIADRSAAIGTPGIANAATLAHDVVHEVAWGTANASIASVVTAASDYDRIVGGA